MPSSLFPPAPDRRGRSPSPSPSIASNSSFASWTTTSSTTSEKGDHTKSRNLLVKTAKGNIEQYKFKSIESKLKWIEENRDNPKYPGVKKKYPPPPQPPVVLPPPPPPPPPQEIYHHHHHHHTTHHHHDNRVYNQQRYETQVNQIQYNADPRYPQQAPSAWPLPPMPGQGRIGNGQGGQNRVGWRRDDQ